jgi:Holliday junction DNA helicase RuvA
MFYYLSGKLALLKNDLAVIDVGGVGYKLTISGTTYEAMPANRSVKEPPIIKLFTYLAVREDGIELFGFATETELATFKLLITVSGVGPKAAMAILSSNNPDGLIAAVMNGNEKAITAAAGVGKKLAQRILLELKDKVGKIDSGVSGFTAADIPVMPVKGEDKNLADATAGLLVLGYGQAEINQALRGVDTSNMSSQEIIKLVLRGMVK